MLSPEPQNGSRKTVEEFEDAFGALGHNHPDFATFVVLKDKSGQDQTTHMLAGSLEFDLEFLGDLADAKVGQRSQQLQNFDATMIGKPFDDALQTLGPRPFPPHNAGFRPHQLRSKTKTVLPVKL